MSSTRENYENTLAKFNNFELEVFENASNYGEILEPQKTALGNVRAAFDKVKLIIASKTKKPNGDNIEHSEDDMNLFIASMDSVMQACNTFQKFIIEGVNSPEVDNNDEQPEPLVALQDALNHLDTAASTAYGSKRYRDIGKALNVLHHVLYMASIIVASVALFTLPFLPMLPTILLITGAALLGSSVLAATASAVFSNELQSDVGRPMMDLKEALLSFKNGKTLEAPRSVLGLFKRAGRFDSQKMEPTSIVKLKLATSPTS